MEPAQNENDRHHPPEQPGILKEKGHDPLHDYHYEVAYPPNFPKYTM
jgi:hypothetical protein